MFFLIAAVSHGVDQRQSGFAFGQIVAHILAHGFCLASIVQHVIHQLESQAQVLAVSAQRPLLVVTRTSEQRAGVGGCFEQHGGFVVNNLHVLVFADVRIFYIHQLKDFPFGNHGCGMGQHIHDFQILEFHHHLEGSGVEEITYQHAGCVAPACIGGTAAAAHV